MMKIGVCVFYSRHVLVLSGLCSGTLCIYSRICECSKHWHITPTLIYCRYTYDFVSWIWIKQDGIDISSWSGP